MKYSKEQNKRFHGDIVGALRHAFRNDTVIPEHKNDGTPEILREYLKKRYSSSGGTVPNDYTYNVITFGFTASGGLILTFNVATGTSGGKADKELAFSWSQLTTFLRNNMDEIFSVKEEPEEQDKPAEKRTYLDILLSSERYEGLTSEHFIYQESLCPYDFIDFYDAPNISDDKCPAKTGNSYVHRDCEKCHSCWNSYCEEPDVDLDENDSLREDVIEAHEKYVKEHPPQLPAPAEETAVTFNYAVLSAELGDYLRRKEQQLKNEYMNFTANCGAIFAEAQEKLAKHGFGENNGLFEKWIASMGFAKTTVYRMIQIFEYRSSQIGTNEGKVFFDMLPKTLQADIAAPSAPPELVEQVMNGDITTHKDYIALKKQLEQTEKSRESAHRNFLEMADENTKLTEKNFQLEKQIVELNSRPVDVAIKPDTAAIEKRDAEIERLKRELSEAQNSGGSSDEQLATFYETLHDKAKYALKDCVYFITETGLTDELREKLTEKFHNFSVLLEMYYDDLEE